jgi:adenosylhomocysteine nucleosidase
MEDRLKVVVVISADIEWNTVRRIQPMTVVDRSPFGEFFHHKLNVSGQIQDLIYFQGGWGKISAAASAQYAIDRWNPWLLVNLGTCGGIEGEINKGEILLVERTLVYDIIEEMGDTESHIAHYTTDLDLSWLREPYPEPVRKGLLVSGVQPGELNDLKQTYGAVAGDWESGSIAYVCKKNNIPCLILRGVSDLVGEKGGEAYEDIKIFERSALKILTNLMDTLPGWLEKFDRFRRR